MLLALIETRWSSVQYMFSHAFLQPIPLIQSIHADLRALHALSFNETIVTHGCHGSFMSLKPIWTTSDLYKLFPNSPVLKQISSLLAKV